MLKGKLAAAGVDLHRPRSWHRGVGVLQGPRRHPGRADPPAAHGSPRERPTETTDATACCVKPSSTSHLRCASVSQVCRCTLSRDSSSNINSSPNAPMMTAEPPTISAKWRLNHAERAAQASEEQPAQQERQTEAERVDGEQCSARPDAVLVRGDAEDRAEDRSDARRPAEAERHAGDRGRGVAEPAELRVEPLLLVEPRRAEEQRAEQEQRHREQQRARQARECASGDRGATDRTTSPTTRARRTPSRSPRRTTPS